MELLDLLHTDFKIKTNSREIKKGDVFLALKGKRADDENMNAHPFVDRRLKTERLMLLFRKSYLGFLIKN